MVFAVSHSLSLVVFFSIFFLFHVVTNIWDSGANPFFGAIFCQAGGRASPSNIEFTFARGGSSYPTGSGCLSSSEPADTATSSTHFHPRTAHQPFIARYRAQFLRERIFIQTASRRWSQRQAKGSTDQHPPQRIPCPPLDSLQYWMTENSRQFENSRKKIRVTPPSRPVSVVAMGTGLIGGPVDITCQQGLHLENVNEMTKFWTFGDRW